MFYLLLIGELMLPNSGDWNELPVMLLVLGPPYLLFCKADVQFLD